MLSYKWGLTSQGPKKGSSLVQVTGDSLTLVSKIESIEEHQALEKDHLDVVNKQWGAKLEATDSAKIIQPALAVFDVFGCL